MAFLALLSLLAALVPSLAWACPVTGRVGTPLEICAPSVPCHNPKMAGMACCKKSPIRKAVSTLANQPCAVSGCCYVVVSPNAAQTSTTLSTKEDRGAQSLEHFSTLDFLAVAPSQPPLLVLHGWPAFYAPDISPPYLSPSFSLHSGRAPPVA